MTGAGADPATRPDRTLLARIRDSELPRLEHALGILVAAAPISIAATNGAFVLCVVLFLRDWWAGRRRPSATPLDGAILAWVAVCLLSGLTSLDPLRSFRDLRNVGLWGIYYVLVWGIRDGASLRTLQNLWLAAGVAAGAQALLQATLGFDLRLRDVTRPTGFFNGHLELGHAMVVLVAVALARWLDEAAPRARALLAVAVAILGGGLVVSDGRGPWLAFGAVAAALAWWRRSWWIALPVVLVVALQVTFLAREPEGIRAYYTSYVAFDRESAAVAPPDRVVSNLWRLTMWREGLRVFALRPVSGTGVETTGGLSQDFRTPWRGFGVAHLHSSFFEILMTRGFLGLAGFLLLLVVAGRTAARGLSDSPRGLESAGLFGGLAAVVAHSVHGLTHFTMGTATIQMGFYLALGLAVGALPARSARPSLSVSLEGLAAGMAVVAALFLIEPWAAKAPLVGGGLAAIAALDFAFLGGDRRTPVVVALLLAFGFVLVAAGLLIVPLGGAENAVEVVCAAAWPFAVLYGAWRLAEKRRRTPASG